MMGANEYTPDTEQVREQYTREQPPHIGTVIQKTAEFERWLEQVKREAKAEGLEEYASTIAYIDDVIFRDAEKDDRWFDFSDAEKEFNRTGYGIDQSYVNATTQYAKYRAAQVRGES